MIGRVGPGARVDGREPGAVTAPVRLMLAGFPPGVALI